MVGGCSVECRNKREFLFFEGVEKLYSKYSGRVIFLGSTGPTSVNRPPPLVVYGCVYASLLPAKFH